MFVTFDDDDKAYLRWVDDHPHGFVVNTFRNVNPAYLMLHRAGCGTIRGTPARGERWTSGDFIKVWADSRQNLEDWARRIADGGLIPCKLCHPD